LGDPALLVWTDNPPPAGINERDKPFSVSLFPNPAKNSTTITISGKPGTHARITVFNSLGQEVIHGSTITDPASGKQDFILDLSGLQSGSYICRVSTDAFNHVNKLTIVR
jgi:hypothetical protein